MTYSRHLYPSLGCSNGEWTTMARPGFYTITNPHTGYFYHGSSVWVTKRGNWHRWALNNKQAKNPRFQEVFDEDPRFEYVYTYTDTIEEARAKEQELLDRDIGKPLCLNMAVDAVNGGVPGRKLSHEQIENLRKINTGRKLTEEHKRKLSIAGKNAPRRTDYSYWHTPEVNARRAATMTGRKQSAETIAKRAPKLRGQKRTPEQIENMRIAQSNRGPVSLETRRKMSAARKGRNWTTDALASRSSVIVLEGVQYESIADAATALGITKVTVYNRMKMRPNSYYVTVPKGWSKERIAKVRMGPALK